MNQTRIALTANLNCEFGSSNQVLQVQTNVDSAPGSDRPGRKQTRYSEDVTGWM